MDIDKNHSVTLFIMEINPRECTTVSVSSLCSFCEIRKLERPLSSSSSDMRPEPSIKDCGTEGLNQSTSLVKADVVLEEDISTLSSIALCSFWEAKKLVRPLSSSSSDISPDASFKSKVGLNHSLILVERLRTQHAEPDVTLRTMVEDWSSRELSEEVVTEKSWAV